MVVCAKIEFLGEPPDEERQGMIQAAEAYEGPENSESDVGQRIVEHADRCFQNEKRGPI